MMMLMSVSELRSLPRRHGNLGQILRRTMFTAHATELLFCVCECIIRSKTLSFASHHVSSLCVCVGKCVRKCSVLIARYGRRGHHQVTIRSFQTLAGSAAKQHVPLGPRFHLHISLPLCLAVQNTAS